MRSTAQDMEDYHQLVYIGLYVLAPTLVVAVPYTQAPLTSFW